MSNAENKLKYMIQDDDRVMPPFGFDGPYYPHVPIYDNSDVTPLIDGNTYFNDLLDEILNLQTERLSGVGAEEQGIYLADWQIEKDFTFPNGTKLTELLTTEAIAGVDVRVLVWMNDYAMDTTYNVLNLVARFPGDLAKFSTTNMLSVNVQSLQTFIELTKEVNLQDKVMLNTLDYPAGSCHMKYALVFGRDRSVGYTGGIDFGVERKSDSLHYVNSSGPNAWHDIQAKIQGDAFEVLFDYYKLLWNELIDRYTKKIPEFLYSGVVYPAVTTLGQKIEATGNDFTHPVTNNHSVQSLRTIPDHTYKFSLFTPIGEEPISFAPYGVYEIQLAVQKAIGNAETYIYIEDQGVVSREIFRYIQSAIKNHPGLKVIILTGYFDADYFASFARSAISHYLLSGLNNLQKEQVVIYSHPVKVHSKIYIIDDKFAIIGSAGLFNRALFVEFEHSISFIDSDTSTRTIQDFRVDLWAEHFRVADNLHNEKDQIRDIEGALNLWNNNWGLNRTDFKIPGYESYMSSDDLVPYLRDFDGVHSYPTSLLPEKIFVRDKDDHGIEFKLGSSMNTANGEHKASISDPAQFVEGQRNFISDNGLPDSSDINISGYWILILQGPNEGACLLITLHSGKVIYLTQSLLPFDSTTTYTILYPFLLRREVESTTIEPVIVNWRFETFLDVGFLPPPEG
jgi:phosphatidylserine/phosphatidylglycerophosphate/cardiolipin synthase-like enzyme